MNQTTLSDELLRAEGLLLQEQDEQALDLLVWLAQDAEEYVDRNCPTTEDLQWFSFPTIFERLCYRRVENDPRELRDVGEPLDRLYADLALAALHMGDYDQAQRALSSAVRWNPMGCGYRLDLAELYLLNGDVRECMALSYSVFDRASDVRHLARAYLNFAKWYLQQGNERAAAAALKAACRLQTSDTTLAAFVDQVQDTGADPSGISDEEADELLESEGLPTGANAEVAICLLMCAMDSAQAQDRASATQFTLRARDLVGEPAAMALLQLIREGDGTEGEELG